jgi:hypothetical protein
MEKLGVEIKKDATTHWIYGRPAELFITFCIFANALQIGAEVDQPCQSRRGEPCTSGELALFVYMELFFMFVFFSEMCIKFRVEQGAEQIKDLFRKPPSWRDIVGAPPPKAPKKPKHEADGSEGSEASDAGTDVSDNDPIQSEEDERRPKRYFDDFFNCFDFVIVWVSVFDLLGADVVPGASSFRVMRILRVVRLVKTLRTFQRLWIIVAGLVDTLKVMFWCFALLGIFCYVAAIYMTTSYGHVDDAPFVFQQTFITPSYFALEDDVPRQWTKDHYFSTLAKSMFTMLQVSTLDKWSSHIVRPIMKYDGSVLFWMFAVIGLCRYGILNVAVGSIAEATGRNVRKQMSQVNVLVAQAEANVMKSIVKGLQKLDDFGCLDQDTLETHLSKPSTHRIFACVNVHIDDARELFESFSVCEPDPSRCPTERYCEGIQDLKGDAKSLQCLKLLKMTSGAEVCGTRCMDIAVRQNDMMEDIAERVEEFMVKHLTERVPEVPEHMGKQVRRNLKLVNNFFQSIFGEVELEVVDEFGQKKIKYEDKLMKWLEENKLYEELEDLEMLRDDNAPVQEVRSMLDVRGRLNEWLRVHKVTVKTLQGLEAWVKEARRYLRDMNLQSRSVSHASGLTGGDSMQFSQRSQKLPMYSSLSLKKSPRAAKKGSPVSPRPGPVSPRGERENFGKGRPRHPKVQARMERAARSRRTENREQRSSARVSPMRSPMRISKSGALRRRAEEPPQQAESEAAAGGGGFVQHAKTGFFDRLNRQLKGEVPGEDALQEMVEHHHLAQKNVQDDERLFGTKETRERIRRSFKRGKRERSSNIQMHWDYSEKF